jgi:hypothetical protein
MHTMGYDHHVAPEQMAVHMHYNTRTGGPMQTGFEQGAGQAQGMIPPVFYGGPGPMMHSYHFVPQHGPAYAFSADNHHAAWNARVPSASSATVPGLAPRRSGSMSSNEDHVPGTPAFNQFFTGVAVMDRSPSGVFTHTTTPSPSAFGPGFPPMHGASYKMQSSSGAVNAHIIELVMRNPAIPLAIPAPNSPNKPLDRCLENNNGETNVYIRGLSPETTDDMLNEYGKRFGDVQSSKAIIDHRTNLCKG